MTDSKDHTVVTISVGPVGEPDAGEVQTKIKVFCDRQHVDEDMIIDALRLMADALESGNLELGEGYTEGVWRGEPGEQWQVIDEVMPAAPHLRSVLYRCDMAFGPDKQHRCILTEGHIGPHTNIPGRD